MGGEFVPGGVLPKLAGSYFHYEAARDAALPVSQGAIVAVLDTSSWGPINEAVLFTSYEALQLVYGLGDSPLHRRVYDAFRGQGLDGRGGAGGVLVYRAATAAAREASVTLRNAEDANAITLTAIYKGTRGNALRATVQAGVDPGTQELVLLDGALVLERYVHDEADLRALVESINANSGWVRARLDLDGRALDVVSAAPAAGGDDGAVLTAAEYTAWTTALDAHRWAILAPGNLTDSAIRTTLREWIVARNVAGKRCRAVFGGAAGESVATANTRSRALNAWDIVNVGVGTLHDDERDEDVSTAQLVPRVAGALAARGERSDMIFVRFAGLSMRAALSAADEESALDAGTTVFTRDTHQAPVFIKEGVTSYSDDSGSSLDAAGNKTHPVGWYRRIKNVAVQQGIELEVSERLENGDIIGELPVNDQTRATVLGFVQAAYRRREDSQIVRPGWVVELDPAVPISDEDDFVAYRHAQPPTLTLRQVFNTVIAS